MKIHNVVSIHDNSEFVTIVTQTGTAIHLPMGWEHSITIDGDGSDVSTMDISIDMCQNPIEDKNIK